MALALTWIISVPAFADTGPGTSGGGDNYTLDFVRTATQSVFPWLAENGSRLSPSVDASDFLMSISPKDIASLDRVFESCDGTQTGREVAACYNAKTGKTFLSRRLYPVNSNAPSKIGLVAHEVFRKMGIESDGYEITKQMSIARDGIIVKATSVEVADRCHAPQEFDAFNGAKLDAEEIDLRNTTANNTAGTQTNSACDVAKKNYLEIVTRNGSVVV